MNDGTPPLSEIMEQAMGYAASPDWKAKADVLKHLLNQYIVADYKSVHKGIWLLIRHSGEFRILFARVMHNKWNYASPYSVKILWEGNCPLYYDVPAEFLKRAPVVNENWRLKVAREAQELRRQKSVKPGMVYILQKSGWAGRAFQVTKVVKNKVYGKFLHYTPKYEYKIPLKMIGAPATQQPLESEPEKVDF